MNCSAVGAPRAQRRGLKGQRKEKERNRRPRRLKLIDAGGKDFGSIRLGLRPEGKQRQRKEGCDSWQGKSSREEAGGRRWVMRTQPAAGWAPGVAAQAGAGLGRRGAGSGETEASFKELSRSCRFGVRLLPQGCWTVIHGNILLW